MSKETKKEETNIIKSLKLVPAEAGSMFNHLMEAFAHGQESRSRNKIIDILRPVIERFEKERFDIIKKHAELDEKGNPTMNLAKTDFNIKKDSKEEFNKEYIEFVSNYEMIFDILPSNEKDFKIASSIVLNSKKDMNYVDGAIYGNLCDKLSKI